MPSRPEDANSMLVASRWTIALGILSILVGLMWLDQYLSTGAVHFERERSWLTGRGAMTAPLAALGGGLCFLVSGIYYRARSRERRQGEHS